MYLIYQSSVAIAIKYHSDGAHFLKRQALFAALGILSLVIFMRVDYHKWRDNAVLLLLGNILLLVLLLNFGIKIFGAVRWFRVGHYFSCSPNEFAKMSFIIYLAYSFEKNRDRMKEFWTGFLSYTIILFIFFILFLLEPDFGSAMTLFFVTIFMLLKAGTPKRNFVYIFSVFISFLFYRIFSVPYQLNRLIAYFCSWKESLRTGFQVFLWPFQSPDSILHHYLDGRFSCVYFPSYRDFITAVIIKENGYFVFFTVILLYILFVWRGMYISKKAPDAFGRFLAFGISSLIGIKAFWSIGTVMDLWPIKIMMATPFLSYGGSDLIIHLLAVGILLNVSSQCGSKKYADKGVLAISWFFMLSS
jgi:cell division protein FtsW